MDNHEKHDIIKKVAIDRDQSYFLPDDQQAEINKALFEKLMLFLNDLKGDALRPESMLLADKLFQDTHAVRIQELKQHRDQGGNIVTVFCHAIPPEVYYAVENLIPVNTCAGGEELEQFAPEMNEKCSLSKSTVGFFNTGMCVFHNVANFAINIKACHSFEQLPNAINPEIPVKFFNIEKNEEVETKELLACLETISESGLSSQRFLEYSKLFLDIRKTYKQINEFRKLPNPPISGKDTLWLQQLYLATSPQRLLKCLEAVSKELQDRQQNTVGYQSSRKRILLIGGRNMPPYTQTYRIIENSGAIIVKENSCMGPEKGMYDYNEIKSSIEQNSGINKEVLNLIMHGQNPNDKTCEKDFDKEQLLQDISNYSIENVIIFSLDACFPMLVKSQRISSFLKQKGIPVLQLQGNYKDTYEYEESFTKKVQEFLMQTD